MIDEYITIQEEFGLETVIEPIMRGIDYRWNYSCTEEEAVAAVRNHYTITAEIANNRREE